MTREEQFEKKLRSFSNSELKRVCYSYFTKLWPSLGKSIQMSVPPMITDTDFVVGEVLRRYTLMTQFPKMNAPADIVIDFDGTCVAHAFPNIGADIGAVPVLQKLAKKNNLILFTMRSDADNIGQKKDQLIEANDYLTQAVKWFAKYSIPLAGIQRNPTQSQWTSSPKAYGQIIIDDAAIGIPLKYDGNISPRPFVDWELLECLLVEIGLL